MQKRFMPSNVANWNKSLLFSSLILLTGSSMAVAETYYVEIGGSNTDCLSWDNACTTIEGAVAKATADGDVIHVAQGVYYPTTISPAVNLTIIGGFKDGGSIANADKYLTILSGDSAEDDVGINPHGGGCKVNNITTDHSCINNANSGRLFEVFNVDFTLKNVTITGFQETAAHAHGAVILSRSDATFDTTTEFDNVKVIGNDDRDLGVSLAFSNGGDLQFTILNSLFEGNRGDAGGAVAQAGTPNITIENTAFVHNDAINDGNGGWDVGGGGAIRMAEGNLTITNALFEGNTAGSEGGAVYTAAQTRITNATFVGNTAGTSGGAILQAGGNTKIHYSTVYDNTASANGGGIAVTAGALNMVANLVVANSGVGSNIHTVMGFTDLGYNLIGANSLVDGGVEGGWTKGVSSFTAIKPVSDIIDTGLSDNGGNLKTIKIKPDIDKVTNNYARDMIPNDSITFLGQGQSQAHPFTTIKQATGAVRSHDAYTAGSYFFHIGNDEFSTTVDKDGYILIDDALYPEAAAAGTYQFTDGGKWYVGEGVCNGAITTVDARGFPRSDFTNPNDTNQNGDIHDCDIGAFEYNDGYKFDCYSEDGMRPVLDPVIDLESGTVNFSQTMCVGGDLSTVTPGAFIDNFSGSLHYMYLLGLGLLGFYRKKLVTA